MDDNKVPLSVAIITKNEEEMLPDCLRSVSFADDIVVVDSESTDRTVEIARGFGCRVFVEPWKGFGPQKNSAVLKCRHNWVLILDADERIPEETREAIVNAVRGADAADAYRLPRKAFFNGKWIKHCGWWPDEIIRLFRKDKGVVSSREVHESVEVQGVVKTLSAPIVHFPMPNIEAVLGKVNLYSSLGARELLKAGRKATVSTAFCHAIASFIRDYFLSLGALDGGEGFFLAFSVTVTTFYKYVKLMEVRQQKK
jgi:glycosyltransferase involved in cell wall biosynthesis